MELLSTSGSIIYTGSCFSGVYGIQCHINSKWYVGESIHIPERIEDYIFCRVEKQPLIYNAIQKYGRNEFSIYTLERCDSDMLLYNEAKWGNLLNSLAPNGYNLKVGGDGKTDYSKELRSKMSENAKRQFAVYGHPSTGRKHSEETKLKLKKRWEIRRQTPVSEETRKKLSMVLVTDETRRKLSLYRKGKPFSETHKENLSKALKGTQNWLGKKHSEETKQKMSQNMKGRKQLVATINWLEEVAPWFMQTT
jgi:group I intron endonuclease